MEIDISHDIYKLFDTDFLILMDSVNDFENKVQISAIDFFIKRLESFLKKIKGNDFQIKDKIVHFSPIFIERGRILSFNFTYIDINNKPKYKTHSVKIDSIGRIVKLELIAPVDIFTYLKDSVNETAKQIKIDYKFFENALYANYEGVQSSLTKNLYEILNNEIEIRNLDKIIGQYWFAVARLVVVKEDDCYFSFSINKDNFKAILKKIQKKQHPIFSPVEIMRFLILDEVPDDGIEFIRQGLLNSRISFSDLKIKDGHTFDFWLSEKILVDSKGVAFYYLDINNSFMVHLTYRLEVEELIVPIIKETKDKLNDQIIININTYNNTKLKNEHYEKKNKDYESNFLPIVRKFIIDFGAKFVAEYLKP